MKTLIALLKGINVGGKNPLPMKELVDIWEGVGAEYVRTYAQSGNVVFQSGERDVAGLADRLALEIKRRRGFQPHVLILGIEEIERATEQNPFPEAESDAKSLHLGFLASIPRKPDLASLDDLRKKSERFRLVDSVFYLHAPEGIGRSRLAANSEKLLGVSMTDRNWRTVCRIRDLASG